MLSYSAHIASMTEEAVCIAGRDGGHPDLRPSPLALSQNENCCLTTLFVIHPARRHVESPFN